jgi:phosphoribosylglycinamide formyltransferase-1
MINILFLASGGGGNMKFFHHAKEKGLIDNNRIGVIADRECNSLNYAKKNNLDNWLISYSIDKPEELINAIESFSPDIIITNWHKILGEDVVKRYSGKLLNLHYSLLPAFGGFIGIKPIKNAINRGCKYIGPTCHLVDTGVDTGYIISQYAFETPNSLDTAIKEMFEYGCITLLDGIEKITGVQLLANKDKIEEKKIFKINFWKELSEL